MDDTTLVGVGVHVGAEEGSDPIHR